MKNFGSFKYVNEKKVVECKKLKEYLECVKVVPPLGKKSHLALKTRKHELDHETAFRTQRRRVVCNDQVS